MRFGERPKALLETLASEDSEALRRGGTVRTYRKSASIYTLGKDTDALYVVIHGRVRLRDRDRDGRDVTVAFAAQGEAFGIEALAELPTRRLSAVAAQTSEVLAIEVDRLRDLLRRDTGLARSLIRHLAAFATHADERVKMLAFLDVPSRLAGMLLWLADRYGLSSDGEIEVPYWFTHQETADLIGSTRETVTTVLADFRRRGLVTSRTHHFVILDREALAEQIGLPAFGGGS